MMHAHAIDIGNAANSVMGWIGLASIPYLYWALSSHGPY